MPCSLGMNPEYSDFKLLCRGSEYALHKCIVCPRSKLLAAACNGNIQVKKNVSVNAYTLLDAKTDFDLGITKWLDRASRGGACFDQANGHLLIHGRLLLQQYHAV